MFQVRQGLTEFDVLGVTPLPEPMEMSLSSGHSVGGKRAAIAYGVEESLPPKRGRPKGSAPKAAPKAQAKMKKREENGTLGS